jgi:acetylornithine deacetylase
MSEEVVKLKSTLAELVAIDSTSVLSNRPIIEFLEAKLKLAGFSCQRQSYAHDAGVEKVNLIAVKGARGGMVPELALVAHSDCVPYDPAWLEALKLVERENKLYGRGSCDNKAYASCILAAVAKADSLRKPLLVVFTADEELGCFGAKKLVEVGLGRARYALVGEPTSLRPIRGNKGYCLAEVEVLGKEGHSAYPDSGVSAIFRASRLLTRVEQAAKGELRSQAHPDFDPPYTTLNVGLISGGRAKNVIPGSCRFWVEWRPVPGQPPELGLRILEDVISAARKDDPTFQIKLRLARSEAGVESPVHSSILRFVSEESGKPPATVAFGTEMGQMMQLGAEAVVFGPGDIRNAHQTGEFVPVDELLKCEQILERAIARFCG